MFICICNQVCDRDVRDAVENGVHDFATLQQQLGVSTSCGTCQESAHAYLEHLVAECSPTSRNPLLAGTPLPPTLLVSAAIS